MLLTSEIKLSANPLEIIVAETGQGRGVLGVIDGLKSKRIETEEDKERKRFLRKIGYKRKTLIPFS